MGEKSYKYSRCTSFLNCGLFVVVPALFFGQLFVIFAIILATLLLTSACTFLWLNPKERKPNPKEALSNFLCPWNIVVFFANGNDVF